jgi:hypothetical protein
VDLIAAETISDIVPTEQLSERFLKAKAPLSPVSPQGRSG